jgi:hypothetical protein
LLVANYRDEEDNNIQNKKRKLGSND